MRTVNSGNVQFTVTVNPDCDHQLFVIRWFGQLNVVYLGVSIPSLPVFSVSGQSCVVRRVVLVHFLLTTPGELSSRKACSSALCRW